MQSEKSDFTNEISEIWRKMQGKQAYKKMSINFNHERNIYVSDLSTSIPGASAL